MSKLHFFYEQSVASVSKLQCTYCERHLSKQQDLFALEKLGDIFRPATQSFGNKIKVIVCQSCKSAKKGLSPEEFLARLEQALANRCYYQHIDLLRMQTIIDNISYILHRIEIHLGQRNLTIYRKKGNAKPILNYRAITSDERISFIACYYCHKLLDNTSKYTDNRITRDHVRPISKHPDTKVTVFCCPACNNAKSNDEPELFLAKLQIAHYSHLNYKNIPYDKLTLVMDGLRALLEHMAKPCDKYTYLNSIHEYHISQLRHHITGKVRQDLLNTVDDYALLELLLLCFILQKRMSSEALEQEAYYLNIVHFEAQLYLALKLGWVSLFYSIQTIDFPTVLENEMHEQCYELNTRGRAALKGFRKNGTNHPTKGQD